MTVEEVFQQLDKILGLANLPQTYSMIIFFVLFALAFAFLLRCTSRNTKNDNPGLCQNTKREKLKDTLLKASLPLCYLLLFYRAAQLLFINDRTASTGYVASSVLAAGLLMLLIFLNSDKNKEKFLMFAVVLFVLASEPLEVSISHGANLAESSLDTVNIFVRDQWRFSYHHPIYSVLPWDSVLDVFLTRILGLGDPTSFVVKAIAESSIALVTVLSVILFASYLGFPTKVGLLTAMLTASLPYLQFALAPTNFSFMFMVMFIMVLTKCFTSKFIRPYTMLMSVLLASSIIAHEMAVLVLSIPLVSLIFAWRSRFRERFSTILLIGFLTFLTMNLHEVVMRATYSYLNLYFSGLFRIPVFGGRSTISEFQNMALSVKLLYILPIAVVGAYVLNLFMDYASKRHISIKGKARSLQMSVHAAATASILLSGFSLIGTFPITRHFGLFAFVCLGLSSAPIFAVLVEKDPKKKHAGLPRTILVVTMIMVVTLGFLTPHKLPDQYVHSAALSGGVIEDYMTTEFLANHSFFKGDIKEIDFVVHTPFVTKDTLGLALPVSVLKYTLLNELEEPPRIVFNIYDDSDPASDRGILVKSLVYNSQYYEVFIEGA